MKKEIAAAAVLVILLAVVLLNTRCISSITEEVSEMVNKAQVLYHTGMKKAASDEITQASGLWKSHERYIRVTVRHSEIDGISEAFWELSGALEGGEEASVNSCAGALRSKLEEIGKMEKLSIGSIF